MPNYSTSVKAFDTNVQDEKTLDLRFDWKTGITSTSMKTGTELRDEDGNLIFAIAATAAELRYSTSGPVSDSSSATEALNPVWSKATFDRTKWYSVDLHLDFNVGRVQYAVTSKEASPRVVASGTGQVTASNLAKLVAANYYGTGPQSLDNFRLTRPQNTADGVLAGSSVYAFGDSIVYGHRYPRAFVDFVAEREGMALTKYARNGATVGPTSNRIRNQVQAASAASPDFVVFDGGTNDAEQVDLNTYTIGAVTDSFDAAHFDSGTYAGSLESTIHTMKQKWPAAQIVHVTTHKLGSRSWQTQLAIRNVTLEVARKWGIAVADVFDSSTFDTRDEAQRIAYTFNNLINGYPDTNGTGTHPNIAGVTKFYVPVLTAKLAQLAKTDTRGLYAEVAKVSMLKEATYSVASWNELTAARAQAEEVLEAPTSAQTDVDLALANLHSAVEHLAPAVEPRVSALVVGPEANEAGWRSGPVSVSLSLNEGTRAGIEFRLGEGSWRAYLGPFDVSEDGETVLEYRAVMSGAPVENSGGSERIRLDQTPPAVSLAGAPIGDYIFGQNPPAPTCEASDAVSGLGSCVVSGGGSTVGEHVYTATATDNAGNVSTAELTYAVLPWDLKGFNSPVEMAEAWNTVKGGSTVPLKFEMFAGGVEITDPAKVKSFTAVRVQCPGAGTPISETELLMTSSTQLSYEDGQFVQKWQTPKTAGVCTQVAMTAADDSKLTANFIKKLRQRRRSWTPVRDLHPVRIHLQKGRPMPLYHTHWLATAAKRRAHALGGQASLPKHPRKKKGPAT
ncbi:PxKF domain-containing protein [[Micrococcus luteus] ATCC 49442]|uniref:PxKF domain-containing protein n=1 Tax=[Micrococcus luteus] ATCC 49442 TaxID=2698727 RepID=UPI0013DCB21E|nr:PxKF domain-containing protein [[Micrococcus luteus] ATCC 49442]